MERSAYVTAPTGWHPELVAEYAEHVVRERGDFAEGFAVRVRLTDFERNLGHTTTWRVRYVVEEQRARREPFRPLSLH